VRNVRDKSSRGLALVTVLWVLVLLSLVAASFTATTRTEVNLTRNLIESAQAEALADAGVYRAIHELLSPKSEGILSPQILDLLKLSSDPAPARRWVESELRAELGETFFPEAGDPFIDGWRTDGTIYVWPFGGAQVWLSIQDEDGKIDLNAAPDELLQGLFASADLDRDAAAALVDAIVDFRDADDLHRLQGAEDRDYADAGLPWGAKDAPFEAVEELQQVLGMTREIYERVAPAVTVYSRRRGIDPAVAPREALLALQGIGPEQVESFLAARTAGAEGTTENLLGAEAQEATSRERIFTIRAEAHTESGAVFVREATIELIGARNRALPNSQIPSRFLAWKQGRRAAPPEPEPRDD
jgi:general secretion pathway protein K